MDIAERIEEPNKMVIWTANPMDPAATNPAVAYLIGLGSKRSRATMKGCLNIVARFAGYAGLKHCPWFALRRHHVQTVLETLVTANRAPATINLYLSAMKGVATQAWHDGQMDTEDYQRIKAVHGARGSRLPKGRALKANEIRALLADCDADQKMKGLRDAAILSVLLGCGLRRSEVVALLFSSLDRDEQSFTLIGKGNKQRKAFLPDSTLTRLDAWLAVRGDWPGALFPRIRRHDALTHSGMTDQAIYHILTQRQQQAAIEPVSPHDLRRTYASMLLDNNEDILTVRDAMGHASVATTQRYDKRGDARLKIASQRLDVEGLELELQKSEIQENNKSSDPGEPA